MSATAAGRPTRRRDGAEAWLSTAERGTVLGLRALTWVVTRLGRRPARGIVRGVILYYALSSRPARQASRQWLEAVYARTAPGRTVAFGDVYRHLLRFGQVTLDRLLLVQGRTRGLEVVRRGGHHIDAVQSGTRGALLVGAHLGSFESMCMAARGRGMKIHVLAYVRNAAMINSLLARLGGDGDSVRLLSIEPGRVDALLEAREAIERGEVVAMLADRVGINDKETVVDFMGRAARFPTGPWLLASLLACPVYLTFGLYHDPATYEIICEPFSERISLPRGPARAEALREIVARYAARLEHHAEAAPDNWFNFYDFWSLSDGAV